MTREPADRIAITCSPDHPVFGGVGESLRSREHRVSFFDPHTDIPTATLDGLSLFVAKQTRPPSVRALVAAERLGVPTWNSATGVLASVSRFSQLCLLAGVGFSVPTASRTKPSGDYVAKRLYHWHMSPEVNGEGDVYEPLLPVEPVDYKYYVVHDGTRYRSVVLRVTSKLWGQKTVLGEADPLPAHVTRITDLMERLGMRGIGVDLVRSDETWYAVDLNPCPSFTGTNLDGALVGSIESALDS